MQERERERKNEKEKECKKRRYNGEFLVRYPERKRESRVG